MVRGSKGAFKLVERRNNMRGSVGKKRQIGTYRTVDNLERGITRYGVRVLKSMAAQDLTKVSTTHNMAES
jgi:hypothetical protein